MSAILVPLLLVVAVPLGVAAPLRVWDPPLAPLPSQQVGGSQGETNGARHASLTLTTSPPACYVHQVFRVRLEIAFDAEFARANMIQLFRRAMDAPLAVQASWLTELPGAEPVPLQPVAPGQGASSMTLAAGDEVVRAERIEDRSVDGRAYTVLVIERAFRPTRAGALEIPAAALRFAYATEFREDFAAGRVPVDRHDAVVHAAPVTLEVTKIPERDQPGTFSGAVGNFSVRASAHPLELEVGASLSLTLTIDGAGFLGSIEPPRLDAASAFDTLGVVDDEAPGPRTITYDLAPRAASVREVPAIPFVFFDPGPPAAYRTVSTAAIPITVRASRAAPAVDGAVGSAVPPPVSARRQVEPDEEPTSGTLLAAALLVAALALALVTWIVRRPGRAERGAAREQERASSAASATFRARIDAGADLADAFTEFLATRLGCAPPAVLGPNLARRLQERGAQPELATRASELLDALVSARYGGEAPPEAEATLRALVAELG